MKHLLIIRVDAIGDYILFRNFIEIVKNSKQYCEYKIFLLCDKSWYELSCFLDDSITNVSFDKMAYMSSHWYRYSLEYRLNNYQFDVIIQPTFSRTFMIDKLINQIQAPVKIGFNSDLSNISLKEKLLGDTYYTHLIKASDQYMFEFDRNREFFEQLLNKEILLEKPIITTKDHRIVPAPFENYIVVMIGANDKKRKWNIKNYAILCNYLILQYNVNIVLCGGQDDLNDICYFNELPQQKSVNLIGSTSLVDIVGIISQSNMIISNDTGLSHIAVSLKKPCLVISNGNHFGRFVPYPSYILSYLCICPFEYRQNENEYIKNYYQGSNLDINTIHVNDVVQKAKYLFDKYLSTIVQNTTINFVNTPVNSNTTTFIKNFANLYDEITSLDKGYKYILYGNGILGKTIYALMQKNIIAFVDQNSEIISTEIIKGEVYNPKNLVNMKYDKIIISVLGREKNIIKYLIEELYVNPDKIITLKI